MGRQGIMGSEWGVTWDVQGNTGISGKGRHKTMEIKTSTYSNTFQIYIHVDSFALGK